MKQYILFSAVLAAMIVAGCKSDDEQPIEEVTNIDITFTGSYGTEALQMQKEYTYGDGKAIKFLQFDFFVSEIVLLRDETPESSVTELKSIDFIDLSVTDAAAAGAGQTLAIQNIPVGTYAGIKLGLGVSADLNRTKPEDYGSNNPLKKTSHYWDAWNSYIFSKLECYADLNEDGTIIQGGADSEGISYHTGTDDVYKEITLYQEIVLTKGVTGGLKLNLDISKAFNMTNQTYDVNDDGFLDLETFTGTHTDSELQIAKKIMENLGNSITLEL